MRSRARGFCAPGAPLGAQLLYGFSIPPENHPSLCVPPVWGCIPASVKLLPPWLKTYIKARAVRAPIAYCRRALSARLGRAILARALCAPGARASCAPGAGAFCAPGAASAFSKPGLAVGYFCCVLHYPAPVWFMAKTALHCNIVVHANVLGCASFQHPKSHLLPPPFILLSVPISSTEIL